MQFTLYNLRLHTGRKQVEAHRFKSHNQSGTSFHSSSSEVQIIQGEEEEKGENPTRRMVENRDEDEDREVNRNCLSDDLRIVTSMVPSSINFNPFHPSLEE